MNQDRGPRIRSGYAINQWKPNFDDFTRRQQHEHALKCLVAAGFTGVELRAGSGRWDPLGRPGSIAANFGSTAAFVELIRQIGLDAVCSWYFDPGDAIDEDLHRGRSILERDEQPMIAETVAPFAEFLAAAGGSRLVVRALPSAWTVRELSADQLALAGQGWNAVGAATARHGIGLTLHVDCLSAAADDDTLAGLLEATDPDLVGLTIDTAELTLAGLDPVAVYDRHAARVDHVQLKDTRYVDQAAERLRPHSEAAMLTAGGDREIERWFFECGTRDGLVDFPGLLERMRRAGYDGWVVFESEQTPNPFSSVMLNGWYAQRVLHL